MNAKDTNRLSTRPKSSLRTLSLAWVILLGLTAGSFLISDRGNGSMSATALAVIGLATLKAHLVAGLFMELIQAPRIWTVAMSAFLLLLGGSLIVLLS